MSTNALDDAKASAGPAPAARRRLLIVVGMHRSGTSATTGALQCLGVDLGDKLYAGHQGVNPKGYFEHSGIADANDEALLAIGSSWDDILARPEGWEQDPGLAPFARQLSAILQRETDRATLFAVKDPRVCRLLPWWLKILSVASIEPEFLFVVRHPSEVHRSLERRDHFSADKSYLLWLLHYLEAERWSRGFPRAVLEFGSFVADPAEQLRRVEGSLGVQFPRPVAQAREDLAAFISTELRHHVALAEPPDSTAGRLAWQVHRLFSGSASTEAAWPGPEHFDAAHAELTASLEQIPAAAIEHMRAMSRLHGQSQLTVNRLARSWSWVLGKPVRFIERLCGRMV